jgi:hypothetical protein
VLSVRLSNKEHIAKEDEH